MSQKILIAEDDKFISKIMKFSLEEEGYQVDHVTNGREALEHIKKGGYGVVLLDLIMPEVDGFAVLTELQKMKNNTPILVFSNLSQSDDRDEALSLGATDYYVKSDIAIDDLVKTVKGYLK